MASKWFLNVTVSDFNVKMPLIVRSDLKEPSQVLLLVIKHIGQGPQNHYNTCTKITIIAKNSTKRPILDKLSTITNS